MAIVAIAAVILKNAWICDDAYITFRTIDNFLNGYGLRWNPEERVQTYTHPLWMFIITSVVCLTGDFYYSTIGFSLVSTGAALALLFFGKKGCLAGALAAAIAVISSKSFVDYSTSGLENALAHLSSA